jgi:hypothetical protein
MGHCSPTVKRKNHENTIRKAKAQHGVHADGWIRTAKLVFFVALGFIRFAGESRPASRR